MFSCRLALACFSLLPTIVSAQTSSWATPTEASNYRTTPDGKETMTWLHRVADAAPRQVRIVPFGTTGEGRELDIVIASKDGIFDPAALHAQKRPIVLVQNTIHAGEMDGKDASMALLRDMVITRTRAHLLDRAVFVFIPLYNADGFARLSPYNRINQNGPELMGWRGNGTNLNLNRDYMKVDTPEARAFWAMFEHWRPDFFVDDHVTDGADFQYDVTFTVDHTPDVPAATRTWITDELTPKLVHDVNATPGHLASPTYIELQDENDLAKGLAFFSDPPRYSCGAMILESRPCMLVEMHMLKDYRTRVTGNYALLVSLLETVNRDADRLVALNAAADEENSRLGADQQPMPLSFKASGQTTPFLFHGYRYTQQKSDISGDTMVTYSHTPQDFTLPFQTGVTATAEVTPPMAYIIPAQWKSVIDVLAAHGVHMERIVGGWTGTVDRYHCSGMAWQRAPFEGRHPLFHGEGPGSEAGHFGHCDLVHEQASYPGGSAVVLLNQPLSRVAVQWLEPSAPDSAMAWGLFDSIFEQKEYAEPYVGEKLAQSMMEKDPSLKAEFEQKLKDDPKFAASPGERLAFFYDRSPYGAANQVGLYPIGRVGSIGNLPLTR